MNHHFISILTLIISCTIFTTGCSEDNDSFESTKTGTPANNNLISQNNFTILFSPTDPQFFDPATQNFTAVTVEVSVQIGDNNNQLITGSRVINFRTEWGLIDPSCTTKDGGCSVTWRSGSPDTMPSNFRNTIIAYSHGGQESFGDINGNGIFDDGDSFNTIIYADLEEPYINRDESFSGGLPTFTTGDIIIDTINGMDLTGANATHDDEDGLFNGPNCAHSTLCSSVQSTVTVWEAGSQLLNGDATFDVGGTVSGLTAGILTLQNQDNNGLTNDLDITASGTYSYTIVAGTTYTITVKTQPAGLTCSVTNGGPSSPTADVTDIDVTCI